jgi:hypothetical protein
MHPPITYEKLQNALSEIEKDIGILNSSTRGKYSVNSFPSETETTQWSKEQLAILGKIKLSLKEYRKKFMQFDQYMLSAFLKTANGEAEMTPELRGWWMNRY